MVTIKDVSKKSGYSVTTVSKALNNYSDIPISTKQKILDLCDEMGYVPNLSARSLVSKKSYTIGIVFEEVTGIGLQHPLFSRILEVFKSKVEKEGYDILFLSKRIGNQKGSYIQHSKRKQVEAVLILCADFNSNDILELYDSPIPSVVIDFGQSEALNITSNNKEAVLNAITILKDLGHKKIAHISGGENSHISGQRIEYFQSSMKENGLEILDKFMIAGEDFSKENGYYAMNKIMKMDEQPTAVFCSSDLLAIGAIQAIQEAGLKVPEDYSIVGFDGTEIGQMISPRLTTIKQDADTIGVIAADHILQMIDERTKLNEGETIYVDCNVIIGESTQVLT